MMEDMVSWYSICVPCYVKLREFDHLLKDVLNRWELAHA